MAWYNFKTAPKNLIAPNTTDFTAPKSRTSLRIRSFDFEGHGGVHKGVLPVLVSSYASPYAPADLASLGVLGDARNRVGF